MNVVMILTVISFIVTLMNGLACILIYYKYMSSFRGVITMVRVDRSGEVRCKDMLSGREDKSVIIP